MKNYLLINTITQTKIDLVNRLFKLTGKVGCHVCECKAKQLGSHYTMTLLIAGSWDAIAKAETRINNFSKKHSIDLTVERTNEVSFAEPVLPYLVQIIAPDKANIVADIIQFFAREELGINEIEVITQPAPHTHVELLSLTMVVFIPVDVALGELRERFIVYCDELNIDAILEPMK